jgi:hypothetical protein
MQRNVARLAAMALIALLASPTSAQQRTTPTQQLNTTTIQIGGRQVRLVVAGGHCLLDRAYDLDRSIFDLATRALAGQNELLLHTADCRGLQEARDGRAPHLSDFAQAQVSLQFKSRDLTGQEAATAREVCQSVRSEGDKAGKQLALDVKERVRQLEAGIGVNETRTLGVLGEDDSACYSGILMNLRTTAGRPRLILGVYAMTVLNGRLVFLYRFLGEPQPGAVDRLLEQQRKAVRDHVALNRRR